MEIKSLRAQNELLDSASHLCLSEGILPSVSHLQKLIIYVNLIPRCLHISVKIQFSWRNNV